MSLNMDTSVIEELQNPASNKFIWGPVQLHVLVGWGRKMELSVHSGAKCEKTWSLMALYRVPPSKATISKLSWPIQEGNIWDSISFLSTLRTKCRKSVAKSSRLMTYHANPALRPVPKIIPRLNSDLPNHICHLHGLETWLTSCKLSKWFLKRWHWWTRRPYQILSITHWLNLNVIIWNRMEELEKAQQQKM